MNRRARLGEGPNILGNEKLQCAQSRLSGPTVDTTAMRDVD